MFEPLPTPAEMAAWDRAAGEDFGVGPEMLMESAAAEALRVLAEDFGPLAGASVLLIAGGGNNGGDAFALARRLLDEGAEALVLHTRPLGSYRGAARRHLELARRAGVELRHLDPARSAKTLAALDTPDVLVDGLLGTGLRGELTPALLELVRAMNHLRQGAFVLSLDIPSGLDGETGLPRPEAVLADSTVAFHAAKLGSALPPARASVGQLRVRRIGIPRAVQDAAPARHSLITPELFGLLKPPAGELHKGRAGHVLVIGGSEGLTGALQLCGLGALRAGAGLVTLACPRGVLAEVKSGFPDLMALPLGQGGRFTPQCMEALTPSLGRYDAVVVGPGLGRDEGAAAFLQLFPQAFERAFDKGWASPCVYDADALFLLSQNPKLLASLPASAILTPHQGEMARLMGMGMGELSADRAAAARRFAEAHAQVLVLKGAGTLVAQGPNTHVSPVVAPNLAVGGSGDVLSGVIAALLAKNLPPVQAACLGVLWHGLCGELLAHEFPGRGNLASEIAHTLPLVLKERTPC